MIFSRMVVLTLMLAMTGIAAQAQNAPKETKYRGRNAYLLTNGATEAIIVPELSSRLMVLRLTGGENALWNAPEGMTFKSTEWANWGGEKIWPSLQGDWALFFNPAWPPHPTYDGLPHKARVLSDGHLETVGPVMEGWGVRATRNFGFDPATGELVITTTFTKVSGEPRFIAAWNVTQVPPPDAIFVPTNPDSPYRDRAYWFGGKMPKEATKTEVGDDNLLVYRPTASGGYKFGTDAPTATAAGVRGNLALILRSEKKEGDYPEGAAGSGFPVTIWNNGSDTPALRYNEIEIMSPLTNLKKGQSLTHVLRLRLIRLPNADPTSAESRSQIAAALK